MERRGGEVNCSLMIWVSSSKQIHVLHSNKPGKHIQQQIECNVSQLKAWMWQPPSFILAKSTSVGFMLGVDLRKQPENERKNLNKDAWRRLASEMLETFPDVTADKAVRKFKSLEQSFACQLKSATQAVFNVGSTHDAALLWCRQQEPKSGRGRKPDGMSWSLSLV
jgi:hypothetical protein